MFTVLIPTFNRPQLLRNALLSVSQQTDVESIDCVIVSENGLNKESEDVCLEFNNIKIKYFFHEQQLPVAAHLKWVLSKVEHGYGAMLCDDDWWDVHHISLAKESILLNKNCVAYFGNHAFAKSINTFKNAYSEWIRSMHFGKADFLNFKPVTYTSKNILLMCSLITPFHFSSMVCKGTVLKEAVDIFNVSHPTYVDRILFAILSTYGDVIYNPLVTSIILFHPNMDGNTYSSQDWKVERQIGSLKIIELAKANRIDIKEQLNDVYEGGNADDSRFIYDELKSIFFDRKNLTWFKGYDLVSEEDIRLGKIITKQNSIRGKLKIRVRNIAAMLYSKF